MTHIGVISDTHGLIRQAALDALAGVSTIIHAGDVGRPEVLETLGAIAPVLAIKGNIDRGAWAKGLPETRMVEVERCRLFVVHNLGDFDCKRAAREYSAVISGHSHKPGCELRDCVLFLNPGSAGPRRFRLPVSIARLIVEGGRLQAEIIELES